MLKTNQAKCRLGEILVNGSFIRPVHLERALAEQERTNERIGEILVRLGYLSPMELEAVLAFHLEEDDGALFKTASAIRYKLGDILLKSGKLKRHQLEAALAEQESTNEKLGEVLVRLELLSQEELGALLAWQHEHLRSSAKAVRFLLGEILVASKAITRDQLKRALAEQRLTKRQIGDILVESGLVKPNILSGALRIQGNLVAASLVAVLGAGFLSGCGSGVSLTGISVSTDPTYQTGSGAPIPVNNVQGTIVSYGSGGSAGQAAGQSIAGVSAGPSGSLGTTQLSNGHTVTTWGDGAVVIDGVPWIHQNATVNDDQVTPDNTCAQAASTMVLHYWEKNAAPSYQQVVDQSNHFNVATSVGTLTSYLQYKGLKVNAYKNGNLDFLKASVLAGHPIICMLVFDGVPHYIVVIGYNDTEDTIIYHDSIDGPNMSLSSSDFQTKWTDPTVANMPIVGGPNYIGLAVDAHE